MSTGLWILIVAVVGSLLFGGYRALTDGRFTAAKRESTAGVVAGEPPSVGSTLGVRDDLGPLGTRATLVQFSSAFCAPCRATTTTLGSVAADVDGVRHVEIDAEQHLDLVRRLGIMRTPTTLVFDADGQERSRSSGAPHRDQVLTAIAALA